MRNVSFGTTCAAWIHHFNRGYLEHRHGMFYLHYLLPLRLAQSSSISKGRLRRSSHLHQSSSTRKLSMNLVNEVISRPSIVIPGLLIQKNKRESTLDRFKLENRVLSRPWSRLTQFHCFYLFDREQQCLCQVQNFVYSLE